MRNIMDPYDVGTFRFCPACGRPVIRKDIFYDLDEQDIDDIDLRDVRCSCCDRPWIACPCTPATEGECGAIISDIGPKTLSYGELIKLYVAG